MENTNGSNVVLVHGGFVDGSGWEDVHNILTRVGHSYGGVVITEAGNDPKVTKLVYIAAFAPDTGESVASLIKDPPPDAPVPPILASQDGYLLLDNAKFHDSFAADVDDQKTA